MIDYLHRQKARITFILTSESDTQMYEVYVLTPICTEARKQNVFTETADGDHLYLSVEIFHEFRRLKSKVASKVT